MQPKVSDRREAGDVETRVKNWFERLGNGIFAPVIVVHEEYLRGVPSFDGHHKVIARVRRLADGDSRLEMVSVRFVVEHTIEPPAEEPSLLLHVSHAEQLDTCGVGEGVSVKEEAVMACVEIQKLLCADREKLEKVC